MVKVLMFGWEFPPHNTGGLGTACEGLTKGLHYHNTQVTFVLPRKLDLEVSHMKVVYGEGEYPLKGYLINSSLGAYITSQAYEEAVLSGKIPKGYAKSLMEEVEHYGRAASIIAASEDFDIIHAHDWLTFKAGIAAKKVSGKYLVVHVHATEFDRTGGNGINQEVYEVEKQGMQEADMVIAVSNFTKRKIMQHYGISENKIKVVHNAVEFTHYIIENMNNLKQNKKIVLYLGRVTLQKGPDYFVSAARKVLDHYKDVVFVLAGTGDMERKIMKQVIDLGMVDKFIFTGAIWRKDTAAAFQMADLYIMPSVSEPFGITPLEALHNGSPVLISHQSGVSEVLTHALKTDFWDTDEMANKIVSVLKHKELQKTLKENGQREVKKMSWDKSAKRVIDLYHELIGRKK